jgi:hypothetical protein
VKPRSRCWWERQTKESLPSGGSEFLTCPRASRWLSPRICRREWWSTEYESDQEKTAVPEKGILTLRSSDASVDLYSADQRLTSEQARQLVLEPLLSPTLPTDLASTGT